MKTYRILSTIRYKDKDLKSGHVVLDDEIASELLDSGHIMGPIAIHEDSASVSSSETTDKTPDEKGVDEVEMADKPVAKPTRATKK